MAIQHLVPDGGLLYSDRQRTSIRPVGKESAFERPVAPVSVIVAADRHNGIGFAGDMLWHISADLKRFKALTLGNAVVMGRKTWESLPRRPLPGRLNVVITRQPDYKAEGARVAASISEAIGIAAGVPEIFIIGGGEIYSQSMPLATRLYLTRILDSAEQADTFFPAITDTEWTRVEEELHPAADHNPAFRFETYVRTGEAK